MTLLDKNKFKASKKEHTKYQMKLLAKRISLKKHSFKIFYCLVPYFLLRFLCVKVIGLFSKSLNQKLSINFIKHYYRLYLLFRGVTHYENKAFYDRVDNPSLIITTRHHSFSSLFVYILFRTPLIIPLNPIFYTEPLLRYVPFRFMGKLLKKISYPDQSLTYNVDTIKDLLKKGYPVLMYINESYINETQQNMIYIGKEFFELLKLDVPTYFLRTVGMHEYYQSTLFTPSLISSTLKEKKDLFNELGTEVNEKHMSALICEFFMFRYANIIT
jgi:hypothetical protein